jgi:DsbC/DsbD-like thiol-disulfide interchange protein
LIAAFANIVNRNPSAFPYFLLAARVQADGQSGSMQYAAHGGIAVSGRVQGRQLTVNIEMQPGWHINANDPLSDDLIPTVLQATEQNTLWGFSAVSYPPPVKKTLGFQSEELALYEGNISLEAVLTPTVPLQEGVLLRLTLRLQACDDEICLPPELLELQIPVPQTP